jgi:hypothetical protein
MMKSDLEKTAQAKSSQGKGSAFELKVGKQIVNYFNGLGIEGLVFKYGEDLHRTEGSGNTAHEKGDIIIPNPLLAVLFPYIIECKAVEGWDLEQVVRYDSKEGIKDWFFVEAWKKCRLQSSRDRIPIVVFTRKGAETYVLFSLDQIINQLDIKERNDRFCIYFKVSGEDGYFGIMTLDGFLASVDPYIWVQKAQLRFQKLQER